MKKISYLLIVIMVFVFVGCSKDKNDNTEMKKIELTLENYTQYVDVVLDYEETKEDVYEIYAFVQTKDNTYKFEGAYVYFDYLPTTASAVPYLKVTKALKLDEKGYSGNAELVARSPSYVDVHFATFHHNKFQNGVALEDWVKVVNGYVYVPTN